jgi:hypothetical protein
VNIGSIGWHMSLGQSESRRGRSVPVGQLRLIGRRGRGDLRPGRSREVGSLGEGRRFGSIDCSRDWHVCRDKRGGPGRDGGARRSSAYAVRK